MTEHSYQIITNDIRYHMDMYIWILRYTNIDISLENYYCKFSQYLVGVTEHSYQIITHDIPTSVS